MPHLQLLTIEKSHLYNEIWCFHNRSLRQPTREMFGSFCSSKTTFFLIITFGRQRQKHKISTHRGKIVKLGPSWEFPYHPRQSLSFTASAMQLANSSDGFCLLSLGFFIFFLFWLVGFVGVVFVLVCFFC